MKGWIVMKNEMSRRQFLGFAGSAAAVLGLGLVGCGGSAGSGSSASGDAAEVYFLQFKPEVDKEWKEIAKGLTPEIAEKSIYDYLEHKRGVKVMASRRTVSVELANDEDCSYLDLGKYNCVAVMESQSYTSDGILFEVTHARTHPEIFHYRVNSKR